MTDWFKSIINLDSAKDKLREFGIENLRKTITEIDKEYIQMVESSKFDPDHAEICYVVYYLLWGKDFANFNEFLDYFGGETLCNDYDLYNDDEKKIFYTIGNFMIFPKKNLNNIRFNNFNCQKYRCFKDRPDFMFYNISETYKKYNEKKYTISKSCNTPIFGQFLDQLRKEDTTFFKKDFDEFCSFYLFKDNFVKNNLEINYLIENKTFYKISKENKNEYFKNAKKIIENRTEKMASKLNTLLNREQSI